MDEEPAKEIAPQEEQEAAPAPAQASYKKLLGKNSDTVGWLTVLGTKIDYPIVKGADNSYYLSRNFNREKDYLF